MSETDFDQPGERPPPSQGVSPAPLQLYYAPPPAKRGDATRALGVSMLIGIVLLATVTAMMTSNKPN